MAANSASGDIESTSTATSPTQVPVQTPSVIPGAIAAGSAGLGVAKLFGIGTSSKFKLPMPNPLFKYASSTTVFTIAALSTENLNNPDMTYMANGKLPIILKTAGGSPTNRVKTKYGAFDFYIDSLEIDSTYGFEIGTGNTNATAINMTVSEPFSMGMFPIALNTACARNGYANYSAATWLLKIEFKGEDQSGNMVAVDKTSKFIPFMINDLDMQVTEAGAVYNIKAVPAGEAPFLPSNNVVTTDITIAGSTVQEILQTGPYSLQSVLNEGYRQVAEKNKLEVPAQEVLIIFPQDSATAKMSATQPGEDEKERGKPAKKATTADSAKLNSTLKVSRSTINNTLIENTVNEIGASSLGFDLERWGQSGLQPDIKVHNINTGEVDQSRISKNPKVSEYSFAKTSSIVNAINQVIMSSDYAIDCVMKPGQGAEKMRKWWRIETAIYHIDSLVIDKKTKKKPQLLVFKVIPYLVHETSVPVSGTRSASFKAMLAQCVKVYSYIFTGKNQDILKLNLHFNNSFNVSNTVDNGNNTTSIATAAQNSDNNAKQTETEARDGGEDKKPGEGFNYESIYNSVKTWFNFRGGASGDDTPAHNAVKWMHEALTYGSDMQELEMDIIGDPYYLTSNGMGNFNSPPIPGQMNINSDGSINYQNGEVDIAIRFKTPVDINPSTGLLKMAGDEIGEFSGLFRLGTISHRWRDGQFTQTIRATRRQMFKTDGQELGYEYKTKAKKPT
jgi:hypothetical protein